MVGQKSHKSKKRSRTARADSSDDDNGYLEARTSTLSADRQRNITTIPTGVARVAMERSRMSYVPAAPIEEHPETIPLPQPSQKQRRYKNSDQALLCWVSDGRPQEFLDEFVRLEGRGDHGKPVCATCQESFRERGMDGVPGEARYTCEDCFGGFMECRQCTIRAHRRLPFHRVKHWDDASFFKRVPLRDLGLRIQLGPHASRPCVRPVPSARPFTMIHETGIHTVNVDFCGCERRQPSRTQLLRAEVMPSTTRMPQTGATFRVLELFEMLSASGRLSNHEFYNSLVRITDNTGVCIPKDRSKALFRMNRQFAHLKMLKRAGRGSFPDGIASTGPGELAVQCPACPRPDINLPENWEKLPISEQYRFRLMIALDANFRLKNLRRPSSTDPGLHTGNAYFVANTEYFSHVTANPRQKDISSCSGFKTLAHAETKNATGLQVTGVGMAVCARHEMIRPLGVGDLQRGERYCNMDYILLSAVGGRETPWRQIFISYDIWCQYRIKFKERMKDMPPRLQLPPWVCVCGGIPKCHCKGHRFDCQCLHCMTIQPGVGRTDGESIERTWSQLNHIASSSKEMLPGARHDMLDRRFSAHNWHKLIGMGSHLHARLTKAQLIHAQQAAAHEEFTAVLPAAQVKTWLAEVEAWEKDLDPVKYSSRTSPYYNAVIYKSVNDVKTALEESDRQAARTTPAIHETSPTACLMLGLLVEEMQCRILFLLDSEDSDSPAVVKDIQEKRVVCQRHIAQFRQLQTIYMFCVGAELAKRSGSRIGDIEGEPIFLPSALDNALRTEGCYKGMADREAQLREAQCYDALEAIRTMQRTKRSIKAFRFKHLRGVSSTTRALQVLDRLEAKSKQAVAKYRRARQALLVLRGPGDWQANLRVLNIDDVRALDSEIFDIDIPKAKKNKLGNTGADVHQLGSGSYQISWIWMVRGATDSLSKDEVDGQLRVEWLKSRARVTRYREEMTMLTDERGFTLKSLEHEACRWESERSPEREDLDGQGQEGVTALARRQAWIQRNLARHFQKMWARPPRFRRVRVPDRSDLNLVDVSDSEEDEPPMAGEDAAPEAPIDAGADADDEEEINNDDVV